MLYLVTFHEKKDKSVFDGFDVRIAYEHKRISKIYTVEMDEETAGIIRKHPAIKAVEADEVLEEDAQEESYAIEMLNAREFWDNDITGKGVKIAVFDGGCQRHEDLNIAGGYNVQNPNETYMSDVRDHGTHCAGIINMQDNDIGYIGIAPDAQMYIVKCDDNKGGSNLISAQVEGMSWAIDNDIDIVSQSLSSKSRNEARYEMFREAAEEHGIIICTSSGNTHRGHGMYDDTIRYPAKHPFVVGCGGLLENKEIRPSSSRGEGLTITAPGTRIMSTVTSKSSDVGNKYGSKSGTSMSTPYIAGMFALYKEKYPHLNRENLIEKVLNEAEYLGDKRIYGAGLIQPPKEIENRVDKSCYVKDLEGNEYILQATIENQYELNGNQSLSATILPTKVNKEFIDRIGEMWSVIDFDGVEHKIIYAKRKGKGQYTPYKKTTVYEGDTYFFGPTQTTENKTKKTIIDKVNPKNITVEIKAIPTFFDALDNDRIYERYDEHMTAVSAFDKIFKGTGFAYLLVDHFPAVEWEGFGEGETKLETFKRAIERYRCEFRISGNVVYLENRIGRDTQFMYRHRLNASNIEQEINAEEMFTYAKGYGNYGDGEGGGDWQEAKLKREYTSPLAKVIGVRHAPPIKNGNITTRKKMDEELERLVKESLKVSVSADIHDLREQGYPIAQSEMGDRVFLIDERIGLDDEIRVVNQTLVRNWKGQVIDLTVTFGDQDVTKRHSSSISTAVKDIQDILNGQKQIPQTALDEVTRNATRALNDARTQLEFSRNGITAIDELNPNLLTRLNSAGLGVSRDGGATYENAITGEGINATVIVAGILHGITIVQDSGDKKLEMAEGELTSYYQGNATMKFGQYKMSFYNIDQTEIGSYYPTVSTVSGEKGIGFEVTDNSHFGIGVNKNGTLYPSLSIIPRNNRAYLAGPYNSALGGSMLGLYANRRLLSTSPTGNWDVTTSVDQPSIILDQSESTNNTDIYFGGRNKRTGSRFHVRWRRSETGYRNIIEASSGGVTVTGDFKADDIINSSSESIKRNIEPWDVSALEAIKQSDLLKWNMRETGKVGYGFVLGDNYHTPKEVVAEGGISGYAHSSLNTKAIQELYSILIEKEIINDTA